MNCFEKFIEKNWHWGINGLSLNSSITSKFIEKHRQKNEFYCNYILKI